MSGGNAVFLQNRDFFGAMVEHVPLLHALRVGEPQARLVVYSPFARGRMFEALGLADEVRVYSNAGRALWSELRERAFDRIVSLRPKSFGLTAVIGTSGARRRIGYSTALARAVFTRTLPRNVSIYRAKNYVNLLDGEVPVLELDECVRWLAARGTQRIKNGTKPWCFMPCGSEERKLWGEENFVRLARRIADDDPNARFVLVLGGGETRYIDVFAAHGLAARTSAIVDASLHDIARAVLDSRAVVSNDCGPSHVAQLSRIPQVSIFGNWDGAAPVRIAEWFNARSGATCLTTDQAAPITSIPIETVLTAVRELDAQPDKPGQVLRISVPTAARLGSVS